jgi:hypothetical protein
MSCDGHIGNFPQDFLVENRPGGVAGGVEDHQFGLARDGGPDIGRIDLEPVGFMGGHGHRHPAEKADLGVVVVPRIE